MAADASEADQRNRKGAPQGANLQHMRPRAGTQKLLLYAVSSTKNAKTATK